MTTELPAIFTISPLPMWLFDAETQQFLAVNPAAQHAYGYTEAEFLQMTLADIRPKEDWPRLREVTAALPQDRSPYFGRAFRHRTKDGRTRFVDVYTSSVDYHGRHCRLVQIVDQTDLVCTVEALQNLQQELEERVATRTYQLEEANRLLIKQNEERLALLMDDLGEILWLVRQDTGEILYLNPAGERFFGATKDSLNRLSRPERYLRIHEEDRQALRHLLDGLSEQEPYRMLEYRMLQPDGTIVWRESRVRFHPPGLLGIDAPLLMGITTDITQRKEAQLALERSLQEQHVLLSEVHHRVKNNLAVLLSLVQLQQIHLEDHPTTAAEALQDVHNRLLAMSLVHQKLYQHALSGHLDMRQYVRELAEQVRSTFGTNAAATQLELDIAPIQLDLQRAVPMGLILNELLTNTWKHALPDGGGHIHVAFYHEGHHLRFQYSDSGVALRAPSTDGTGKALIRALCRQLHADFVLPAGLTHAVDIRFPLTD